MIIKSLVRYFLDQGYVTLNRRLPEGYCRLSKALKRSDYTKMSRDQLALLVHVIVESSRKPDKHSIEQTLLINLRPEECTDIISNGSRFRSARTFLVDKGILIKKEDATHYYYYNPTILSGLTWPQIKEMGFIDRESRIKL